ncbi:hypothetical protein COW53_03535 [bacterium CG17_big_fil_post_rev_8_21_14_2_50_64_8]|nr:MAG: hypothetical protein COW53_03535 [bacterium CG17_big_fil_post_rev_8_21_14_2_50_64_8]PJA75372.1 MAG: hypothetical protein CO151_06665 [bacterium CG_4_9_14_3_um_filter_65_15]
MRLPRPDRRRDHRRRKQRQADVVLGQEDQGQQQRKSHRAQGAVLGAGESPEGQDQEQAGRRFNHDRGSQPTQQGRSDIDQTRHRVDSRQHECGCGVDHQAESENGTYPLAHGQHPQTQQDAVQGRILVGPPEGGADQSAIPPRQTAEKAQSVEEVAGLIPHQGTAVGPAERQTEHIDHHRQGRHPDGAAIHRLFLNGKRNHGAMMPHDS